jgi:hypothetical protein
MSKHYRFVGVSRDPKGVVTVRWANELGRARTLERNGHTEVVLFDLGQPEHKEECMDQLLNLIEEGQHDLTHDQVCAVYKEAQDLGFRIEVTI